MGDQYLGINLDHNSYLAKKRYVIEQVNGLLKRKYRNGPARCFNMKRVLGDVAVSIMCHNIVRALNLSKISLKKLA